MITPDHLSLRVLALVMSRRRRVEPSRVDRAPVVRRKSRLEARIDEVVARNAAANRTRPAHRRLTLSRKKLRRALRRADRTIAAASECDDAGDP